MSEFTSGLLANKWPKILFLSGVILSMASSCPSVDGTPVREQVVKHLDCDAKPDSKVDETYRGLSAGHRILVGHATSHDEYVKSDGLFSVGTGGKLAAEPHNQKPDPFTITAEGGGVRITAGNETFVAFSTPENGTTTVNLLGNCVPKPQ